MTVRTQTLYWHENRDDDKPRPTQLCLLRASPRMGGKGSLCLSLYRWRPFDFKSTTGALGCWLEQVDAEFTLPDDVVVEWAYAEEA